MRRQTELRTVSREDTNRTPTKSVTSGSHETLPVTVERNIFSTLNDMERMMEEAFHRPFFGMSTLPFRQMFRELGSFGEITPTVDVFEAEGEVIVKAEIPGIKREDINVKLVGNNIVISGEKTTEEKVERKDFLRVERSHGSFNRTVALPEGIDAEHIKASYKDGVLEVRLPKIGTKGGERRIVVE